jgi:hypothetical protein
MDLGQSKKSFKVRFKSKVLKLNCLISFIDQITIDFQLTEDGSFLRCCDCSDDLLDRCGFVHLGTCISDHVMSNYF